MGVPAFFRWLTLRYPKIVIEAREEIELGFDINKIIMNNIGIDEKMPSIDNLYFDMNGIIHPCAHPEDRDPPSSLSEMFNSIFDYCDKLIRIVKPKKLIYMAIDGVAPRAKMNQQRSRRFRAAMDAQQKERITSKIEKEWRNKGLPTDFLDSKKNDGFKFDSNFITPGTEFLDQCSIALRTYIKSRLNNDPLWKDLNVIFSDASVPGEGEHKILDFIRSQRTYDNYDPNTYHCIYGADADLIMLSLIMHEPHFCVIRESLTEKYNLVCQKCGRHGHLSDECDSKTGKFNRNKATKSQIEKYNKEKIDEIEFSLLKIGVLREYLELEFKELIKLEYDFERIIDDFVFLCFLVGNDFLPNLPSLKIREGAVDALIYLYKHLLPKMKNYLTNGSGKLNLKECETLFKKLSIVEDKFFKKEMENKKIEESRKNNPNHLEKTQKPKILDIFRNIPTFDDNDISKEKFKNQKINKEKDNNDKIGLVDIVGNISSIEKDKKLNKDFNLEELKKNGIEKYKQIIKEEIYEENNKKVDEYIDKIKLGQKDWKDRYYRQKFHVSPNVNDKAFNDLKEKIKKNYIEGLFWVFEYYYNGCVSWSWFYPFHYAPFASDLTNLQNIKVNFDLNRPFYAFEQLLSVLPPYSADALPPCFRKLMRDPLSPIADFYPSYIKLDINNQPYAWMGVNLLPFIDAERVQKIVKSVIDSNKLNEKEKKLNERGDNLLISKDLEIIKKIEGNLSINSEINTYNEELKSNSIIKGINPGDVKKDKCQCFNFKKKINNKKHCSKILEGVKPEKKCIIEDNLEIYKSNKFKGKQAIEIVKEVLGIIDDDLYVDFSEVENEPKKKFLWMKKRKRDNEENWEKEKKRKHNFSKRYNEIKEYNKDRSNKFHEKNYSNKKYSKRYNEINDNNKNNSSGYKKKFNRGNNNIKKSRNNSRSNKPSIHLKEEETPKKYKIKKDKRTQKTYDNQKWKRKKFS